MYTNKKSSEYIEEFINFVSNTISTYNDCVEEMQKQDKLTH